MGKGPRKKKAKGEMSMTPGVKLVRTLRGHTERIGPIAWSPDGRTLASCNACLLPCVAHMADNLVLQAVRRKLSDR